MYGGKTMYGGQAVDTVKKIIQQVFKGLLDYF